jgi:sugar phosphate isomerase/epimerase
MSDARLSVSRRGFLKVGAAGAAALATGSLGRVVSAADAAKKIPVGLQLYSVRHACEKDLPGTVAKVAQMGYKAVEFAGYYGRKAEDLKKILDENGLACCGTHTGLGALRGDAFKATVDFHKTIGCKFIIVPGGVGKGDDKQSWLDAAKEFNEIAETLKEFDMFTGYHNHSHEFKAVDGQTLWDILFSNTSDRVCQQIDLGNAMGGGGKPLDLIKKYPGRTRTIHLKEHGGDAFGKGQVPWDEVFALCETVGGTQWYIVEHERSNDPVKTVEDVKIAAEFLKAKGKM